MKATFQSSWKYTWNDIWVRLQLAGDEGDQEFFWLEENVPLPEDFEPHDDLYSELFRAAHRHLAKEKIPDLDITEILSNPELAADIFRNLLGDHFASEYNIILFMEAVTDTLYEFDDFLADRYKALLSYFLKKYNLRYTYLHQDKIYPSLSGVFSSLISDFDGILEENPHLSLLKREMDTAFFAIKSDNSEAQVKILIHKIFNLIEAVACEREDVSKTTLGEACSQMKSWPHAAIKKSLSSLYGFASDYPGLRHAGSPNSKLRALDMRDLVSLSVILSGYMPYLIDEIDYNELYIPGKSVALQR